MQTYSTEIHSADYANSKMSGKIILQILLSENLGIQSIIDVGGGIGAWLHAASELGVTDLNLMDGEYVTRDLLKIPGIKLTNADLEKPLKVLPKKFDALICVEVAEHLTPSRGESFVSELCQLSDLIVFSAAIPGQGGYKHINEKYLSYWRQLFADNSFELIDSFREQIWNNDDVEWWYRQNVVLFKKGKGSIRKGIVDLVHPRAYQIASEPFSVKLELISAIKRRLNTLLKKV